MPALRRIAPALAVTVGFLAIAGAGTAMTDDVVIGSEALRLHRGDDLPAWYASSTSDSTCWKFKSSERAFASKIGLARKATGKNSLHLDPELSKAARVHTKEMVLRNLLYHTPSDKLRRRVTFWSILGENVGVGNTVDSLHAAFMNSPAHRENILYSAFRHVGVAVKTVDGRMWVTVIFEAKQNPGTRLRMPSC